MLSRAVKTHETSLPVKKDSRTLSQTLFPSSSPPVPPKKSQASLKSSKGVFQPTSSSFLNKSSSKLITKTTSLKRSFTDANLANYSSKSTNNSSGAHKPLQNSFSQPIRSGVLAKLHEPVEFDENDFDDDEAIALDLQNEELLPTPKPVPQPLHSQAHPTVTPAPQVALSSSPEVLLPWSSSPIQNRAPKKGIAAVVDAEASLQKDTRQLDGLADGDTSSTHQAKRRKLPWSTDTDERSSPAGPPPHVQDIINRQNNGRRRRGRPKGDNLKTPQLEGKISASLPWDKTASAMKEEQKKFRNKANQGKKLTKDGPAQPEGGRKNATKTSSKYHPCVSLSAEQKRVKNLVVEDRKSIFFTGSAGTGKSVLMREIIKAFREKYQREPDRVAVTASTGLAACNLGGVTLHSFAGIGLGKEPAEQLVKKIKKNMKAKNRWTRTKVLIIDEISMVDGDLFDKLERVARVIRGNARPFGGIQLVVTGDFFQLPPVPERGTEAKFSFEAASWPTSIDHTIGLTHIFRQKDPAFASMLNEMRVGRLSAESAARFSKLSRQVGNEDDWVDATELFPTRREVENANNMRMKQLIGTAVEFRAVDSGEIRDIAMRTKLLENCMAPQSLILKKGAQVMLIKNIDDVLVNGSIGKVMAFMSETEFDHYQRSESSFQSSGDIPENEDSLAKIRAMANKEGGHVAPDHRWPMVRFQLLDGGTKELLCTSESWKVELPNGEVQAARTQVPLILAWALSIHKAQGQTLERVKVDLGKIFEKGQAYVALSRATSLSGLQVLRFDPSKVMAHYKVRGFYDKLYNVTDALKSRDSEKGTLSKELSTTRSPSEDIVDLEDDYSDFGGEIHYPKLP